MNDRNSISLIGILINFSLVLLPKDMRSFNVRVKCSLEYLTLLTLKSLFNIACILSEGDRIIGGVVATTI